MIHYFRLNDYEKILCISLSSEETEKRILKLRELISAVDINDLFNQAKIDELDSHLAWLIDKAEVQVDKKYLEPIAYVENRIAMMMNELERIAGVLKDNGIKVVALKNAGIVKAIYKNYACSPMGDLDLLVTFDNFNKAHQIIINDLGYTFEGRSYISEKGLINSIRTGGTEYYKIVKGRKLWIELQWRPIAGRWIQIDNEPKAEELMAGSIEVPGSSVRILSSEDNLLQVCLHTAKHSYCRAPGFRLHSDVDRIVRFTKIDWAIFLSKVKKCRVKTAVYFSLFFAKKFLNSPIPTSALKELKPYSLKNILILRIIFKAGFFNQNQKKFSKITYILFNMLLYDSVTILYKAIFPSVKVMRQDYESKNPLKLLYCYGARLYNLLYKRENI